jgi:hypothetical protein
LPSLTSGSVLFSNGTTIAQNNANFFWDNTNSFLGVGTNIPSAGVTSFSSTPAFQFKAAGAAPAMTFSNTLTSATLAAVFGLATSNNQFIFGTATGDFAIANQSTSAGAIVFGTGTTEKMRMTSAGTFSIGNTNSTYNLDVTGTGRFTSTLTANQLIAGGASTDNVATLTTYDQGHALKLKGSTGDLFFVPYFSPLIGARITAQNSAASANTPLSFYASNFYFNSNVNFGSTIGNGTYTYTLPSATGTLALTSNLSAYLPLTGGTLTGALSGTSATFSGSGAFGSAAMSSARLTITDGTSIAAYWKATNTNSATRDWTIITNNNNFGDFAIRQGNSQGADATSGTDRLFISSGGNVGIGTSSPTAKLQIANTSAGAATVALFLNNNSTTSNTETRLAFAANGNDDISTNRYSYISALNTSGSNGQALLFATNETGNSAVERMRIASGGNVGIGTTGRAWNASYKSLEIGNGWGMMAHATNSDGYICSNTYYDNNWRISSQASVKPTVIRVYDGFTLQTGTTAAIGSTTTLTTTFEVTSNGNVGMPSTYGFTTSNAANLYIDSGAGFLYRSTSSLKYKTEVEDLNIDTTELLSKMRPVWYRSLGDVDRKDWSWYGFIAEELAEIEPRLVHFGYGKDSYEQIETIDDKGNTKIESKLKDNAVKDEPDGVQYERITVLLVAEMQKMRKEIEELKAKIK